jgi:hypothetical protein
MEGCIDRECEVCCSDIRETTVETKSLEWLLLFCLLALCRNVHLAVMFRDWISIANIKHAQKMEHLGIKCLAHVNLNEHFKGYAL